MRPPHAHNALSRTAACRFFLNRADFDQELRLYRHPVLSQALPPLVAACDNAHGAVRSAAGGGAVLPPHLVLERGVTLRQWAAEAPRGFGEVYTMMESLAKLLKTLHDNGIVHRDVKPGNTLYLVNSAQWRLLDVGIAAPIGAPPASLV